ncbi:tyrosine-type recombinase/integrase [Desulfitobacterium hafniense]|uniref:Tyr recombinase domain-containing protein n=1 Tax=Desulfitobacterium hafniense (strain Y51) TaxID=138119 RepID=Q24VE8_DESHY|nr:site-specific integrase [Desulfitobacterium hafniense]BAE83994.1 hypothetical protein DSY2205 [Desulfitobacterium hafniense Y51]
MLFNHYFGEWINLYKRGTVAAPTLQKYEMTYQRLKELAPDLTLEGLNRGTYQGVLNAYAATHEKQTVMDFHRHLKACLADAREDGIITCDPTRKAVVKGKMPAAKKTKYLSMAELRKLLSVLPLNPEKVGFDWMILLLAKTGLRYAEALALTPSDFDLSMQKIYVRKTWNYKFAPYGFAPTKNSSSMRDVSIDAKTATQFKTLIRDLPEGNPIFVDKGTRIFNSTANNALARYCRTAGVPIISAHSLRHTHASVLIAAGVSIQTVSRRLGHSNTITTQNTYLHIIRELEERDRDKTMECLSDLMEGA